MNQIEQIELTIKAEMIKLRELTRGSVVMSPKAKKTADRIQQLTERRNLLIANQTYSLGENLPDDEDERNKIYRLMVKIPIVADFLYACCVELHGALKKYNIQELTLTTQVENIKKQSKDMAFILSNFKPLERILTNDDTLIDALDRKVESFLDRHMKITEK